MKKLITIWTVALLMIVPTAIIAQTPEPTEIKRLNDSITRLNDSIKILNSTEYQGNQLKNIRNQLKQYQDDYNVKEREVGELNDSIETLNLRIEALEKLNNKLEPGWKCVLREMAENVDQVWLNKSFGEIDSTEFTTEFKLYEKYKGEDKGVGEAYKKLKTFRDNYLLFLDGVNAVNSPYDRNKVKSLVALFKDLMNKETRLPRSVEVKTVFDQLQQYDIRLGYFRKYVIDEVDGLKEQFSQDKELRNNAWKQIDMYLKTKDNGQVEKYLTMIPWLGQQYHNYVEALKKDPYGYNEAREIIKGLEP